MIYGFTDTDGRLWEVHNDSTVTKLPKKAIEISQEQFDNRFDWVLDSGVLINSPLPPSEIEEPVE